MMRERCLYRNRWCRRVEELLGCVGWKSRETNKDSRVKLVDWCLSIGVSTARLGHHICILILTTPVPLRLAMAWSFVLIPTSRHDAVVGPETYSGSDLP